MARLTEAEEALDETEEAVLHHDDEAQKRQFDASSCFGTHPAGTSTTETRGLVLMVMLVLSLLRVDRGSGVHGI